MRIHIISCRVLTREFSAFIAKADNHIDVSWLPQGLHDVPAVLHKRLDATLDQIEEEIASKQIKRAPDYIVLGDGLCSNATTGLVARSIPLVVPRADDCITLFLGSRERYQEFFTKYSGTYWLTNEWVENSDEVQPNYFEDLRRELMEKYDGDEDTVEYLMSVSASYVKNYKRVGFIKSCVHEDPRAEALARGYADRYGLDFFDLQGDNGLLKKIIEGDFDEENFLTVPPGYGIKYTDGPERMIAVPADEL